MLLFQAYLSLPEGTASVVGLKAMMTDHYNVMVRLDYNFKFSPDFGFYLEFVNLCVLSYYELEYFYSSGISL